MTEPLSFRQACFPVPDLVTVNRRCGLVHTWPFQPSTARDRTTFPPWTASAWDHRAVLLQPFDERPSAQPQAARGLRLVAADRGHGPADEVALHRLDLLAQAARPFGRRLGARVGGGSGRGGRGRRERREPHPAPGAGRTPAG